MSMDKALRLIAGVVVLAGTILGLTVHEYFFGIVVFAALNQIQSSFSNWCPVMPVLGRFGFK